MTLLKLQVARSRTYYYLYGICIELPVQDGAKFFPKWFQQYFVVPNKFCRTNKSGSSILKIKKPLKRERSWHFQNLYYLSDILSEYCGKEGAWLKYTG